MEIRRGHLIAVAAIAGIVGALLLGDLLIVTDEEELEALVESMTGEISAERIEAALQWVDPAAAPVEVVVFDRTEVYEDAAALADTARDGLAQLHGERLRTMRESIEVDGDTADISLQLASSRGLADVDLRLVRRADRWLITRIRIRGG